MSSSLRDEMRTILGEFYNFGPGMNALLADPAIDRILAIPAIKHGQSLRNLVRKRASISTHSDG